jgi:excisionase family DNA binding protein
MNEPEILTMEEAARFLKLHRRSVVKLLRSGSLPGRMVLNKWRFEKEQLAEWVRTGGKKK